jgi:hypothetical protein
LVANTKVVVMEIDSTLSQDIRKGQLKDEKIQETYGTKKASHLVSLKMTKECYGTKEEFVYLTSR